MTTQEQPRKTGLANISEAASYLRVARKTVRTLIDSGALSHVMVGSHRRVKWESIYKLAGDATT